VAAVIVICVAAACAVALSAIGGGSKHPNRTPGTPIPTATGSAPTTFDATTSAAQLSVAEELGPDIVTARVAHLGGRLTAQVNALTGLEVPAAIPISLQDATVERRCGPGCYDASLPGSARTLTVDADIGGTRYAAQLPIRFEADDDQLARSLLDRVDAGQLRLRSAVVDQSLRSLPTAPEITVFELEAPNRFTYQVSLDGRSVSATIIIGTKEWVHVSGKQRWQSDVYGATPFSDAGYLDWWAPSAGAPRLLDLYRSGSIQIADIAALSELPDLGPVWFRLHVDVTHDRLLRLRMITAEHFMTQTWSKFNVPQRIDAPA
jgi:hypothetical protein